MKFHAAGLCHSDHHITEGDALVRYRWSAGTRAPAWWSRSARTSAGSSPATGWSAPTSRPAASAGPARPGTRTCATRARTPGPACSPTVPSASTTATGPRRLLHARHLLPVRGRAGWACIKLPDDIPFEIGSLVGCGVPTVGVRRCTRPGCGPGTPWSSTALAAWAATRCRARGTPGRRTSWWSTRWSSSGTWRRSSGRRHVRRREGGPRLRCRHHPRSARRPRDLHARGAHRGDRPRGDAGDRQGRQGDDHRRRQGQEGGPRARRLPDRLPAQLRGALFGDCSRSTTYRGCSGCTAPATSSWTS